MSEQARKLAEKIIRKIGDASAELVIVRNNLENESLSENGMESTVEEVKDDLFNVLMGHDSGCIAPEELDETNCEYLWLAAHLEPLVAAARDAVTSQVSSKPNAERKALEKLSEVLESL